MARRTLREAKGASAEITPIDVSGAGTFSNIAGVQAGTPRTRLGNLVPAAFISSFPTACRKELVDAKDAPLAGSGQALQLDSEVMWYHHRKGLGVVTGAKSYAVMVVDMHAGSRNLGRIQIVASSGASRTDAADMAEAMADEFAVWIRQRQGKSPKKSD